MNRPDDHRPPRDESRARRIKALLTESVEDLPAGALRLLVQELRLHQIELEMQNEELRITHAALDVTREHYFNLYDLAPVAYCTVDASGMIQQINLCGARLLSTERESVVGLPLARFIAPEHRDHFYLQCRLPLDEGAQRSCEMRLLDRAGEQVWVEMDATAAKDDLGEPQLRIVLIDVTARRQAAQLREKQEAAEAERRAMSRFLSAASHDLRQPTHAMGLLIDQLKQLPGSPKNHVLVSRLDASVHTLEYMLNALLDLSRLDADFVQAQPQPVPFARLVEQLRPLFPDEGLRTGVRLKFRPSHVWLYTDLPLLQRVIHNLVGNALRFTPQGTVLVACRPANGGTHARIEVRDSGIGIAPDHLNRIFDEFFQVDNPERDRSKGLGLGLSIVRRTCDLLGHPIHVQSLPGWGSCFSVTVPLAPPQPALSQEPPARTTQALSQDALSGLNGLIIEDDAMACDALFDLLKTWKAVPHAVEGLESARALVAQGLLPDFIVSDHRLRGHENGIDAILALRELTRRNIPACLVTGDMDKAVAERARSVGIALLYKPARPAALRELILSII
ncbi:MAG: hybrid sensor histidine kinase/response regulator [Hydrogenophaga sp.]|uniref:ATP-binding response regulator n=1 Tax=Hydrogenophaga sp. TaxID=1904254 RepID=UPI003D10F5AD